MNERVLPTEPGASDMTRSHVVLVDENDTAIGTMPKMEAHEVGRLHRAFSVFVFNDRYELLMQKRAHQKYHSGGLWTNTCCSHPPLDQEVKLSAAHRLQEEMGFSCELQACFGFVYRAEMENGLIEHEYDHVFTGTFNGEPHPDPDEVSEWKYVSVPFLLDDIEKNPHLYTTWFCMSFPRVCRALAII